MKKKRIILALLCFFVILNLISIFSTTFYFYSTISRITGAGGFTGIINLLIEKWQTITILSPQNTTYNFSMDANYTVELNVSSNFNVANWWYTLLDLKHGTTFQNNVSFTPNITIEVVRGLNELIVYANDISGKEANDSIIFNISIPNSAPIMDDLDSDIYSCENDYLSYYFNVTDVDEDILDASIAPTAPDSPFYVSHSETINLTLQSYEIFSGLLGKSEAGGINAGSKTHQENVSVNDGLYADSKQTNITVIEINNAPQMTIIGVQTIWIRGENNTFYHETQVNDLEDGNQDSGTMTFDIKILNSSRDFINLFNISSNGIINYTPTLSDIGIYTVNVSIIDRGLLNPHQNISLCNQDGSNITSELNFSLTVTDENRAPEITYYYPTNLNRTVRGDASLYFNISMYDPDGTFPDTYWYVDDVLEKYISGLENGSSSNLTYTFGCETSGLHTIKAEVTDGLLNDSIEWTLSVQYIDCAPPSGPPPPGGGGGIITPLCSVKWGCSDWGTCQNAKKTLKAGILSEERYKLTKESCVLHEWDEETCGFQVRTCFDTSNCNIIIGKPAEIQECYYVREPSCQDGIKNCHDGACEVLVDCGGSCKACPTCSDGIQNQEEEEIDCGGPCPPCLIEKPLATLIRLPLRYFLLLLIILLVLIVIIRYVVTHKLRKQTAISNIPNIPKAPKPKF